MDFGLILGGALAGGAKAANEMATGQINDAREVWKAQILSDIQLERSKALEEWKGEYEDTRRVKRASLIESEARWIAGNRVALPKDVEAQSDAAAKAYGESQLSDEDKAKGLEAVNAYVRENEQPNRTITRDDRIAAAEKLGYISPEKSADMVGKERLRELRAEIAQARIENKSDIAETNNRLAYDRLASAERIAAERRQTLTPAQRVRNFEIDKAREKIADLSPEEIKRRTQTHTATGRENADYDQLLAARVRTANRRKYGEDDWFDRQDSEAAQPDEVDIVTAFGTDPAMKGKRLGKQTPKGFEVFDSEGRHIGYYRN